MDTALILESISRHINLSPDEQEEFLRLLEPRQCKRKQRILTAGQVCPYSTFVTSGCLRGFTTDSNGFEHTLSFAPAGWWIADMYSLLSGNPANLTIDALEDSSLLLLSKPNQELLYQRVPKFERFFRIITENSLVAHQQRIIDNLSLSAEERYLNFCKRYPTLVHSLPQKHIAAYVGVTPEFFSKMRSRLLSK